MLHVELNLSELMLISSMRADMEDEGFFKPHVQIDDRAVAEVETSRPRLKRFVWKEVLK